MKGVLGSFGKAFLPKHNENRRLIFKEDIRQFGKLMETIVQSYQQEAASEVKAQIMYILNRQQYDSTLNIIIH